MSGCIALIFGKAETRCKRQDAGESSPKAFDIFIRHTLRSLLYALLACFISHDIPEGDLCTRTCSGRDTYPSGIAELLGSIGAESRSGSMFYPMENCLGKVLIVSIWCEGVRFLL